MTFYLSKLLWFVFRPLNLILLLVVVGLVLRWVAQKKRWLRRLGTGSFVLAGFLFLLFGFTNFSDYLLYRLENSYTLENPTNDPAGIIILGGGLDGEIVAGQDSDFGLRNGSGRLIAGFALSNAYPNVPFVYSGGLASLFGETSSEGEVARRIATSLFGNDRNMILEDKSRNTWENAIFSYQLLKPKTDKTWIVVTSAFHALRAAGCFKKAGFNVEIRMADFRSEYEGEFGIALKSANNFQKAKIATKEIIGIIAYRWLGRME